MPKPTKRKAKTTANKVNQPLQDAWDEADRWKRQLEALGERYTKVLAERNELLKKDLHATTTGKELADLRRQVQSLQDSRRAREDALCSTLGVPSSGDVIPAIRSIQRNETPVVSVQRSANAFVAVYLGEARDMLAKAMRELGIADNFTE